MEAALEAGADDVRADGDGFLVETEAGKMHDVLETLEKKGLKSLHSEVGMYPDTHVRLEGNDAEKMFKLVQALEDHDDVQNVYANYDIDEALMEQLSASGVLMRILGIDPGTRYFGYGVVERLAPGRVRYVECGVLEPKRTAASWRRGWPRSPPGCAR